MPEEVLPSKVSPWEPPIALVSTVHIHMMHLGKNIPENVVKV
jgi:hypothetical protein